MRYTIITMSNVRISAAKRLQRLMLSKCSKPILASIRVQMAITDCENFKLFIEIL